MKNLSIWISNFKCFRDEPQGLTRILPVNVIIGRNNSGKSALLDMVDGIITGKFTQSEHKYRID
ncbi:MAG: AAA family ATPase [Candidatus Aegiribacteria sp.]|nr:AAA family ATPase [Candidatus Aegiribacteria sp.]